MPEYLRIPLKYPVAASVQQITAAIDDLKAKHVDGFMALVKTGPTTYSRSEIESIEVWDPNNDNYDVSLSTVLNFEVVPRTRPSAGSRRRASKTHGSVVKLLAEVWIGECPTGPCTIDLGETTVQIHQKVDPLVGRIIEMVNLRKVTKTLGLD